MSVRGSLRQRAQVMGLASVAIVAMVAMLAFVVDAGRFFMIRRELQNVADAAALAGAAYFNSNLTPPSGVPLSCAFSEPWKQEACLYVRLNAGLASGLCNTPVELDEPEGANVTFVPGHSSPMIRVTVRCHADYTFGRILNLTDRPMSARAAAALASWNISSPGPPRITDFASSFPTTRLVDYDD